MRHVMVTYRVHPGHSQENEALVRAVYDELHEQSTPGLRYATFRLDDGVSFVHVAETAEGAHPLAALDAFSRFQAGIQDRCEQPPVVTELKEIGSYRFHGEPA